MSSLNRVVLIGNLTRDPELRYTPSGAAMTKFGLAINRKYKAGDDWKEEVCFVDIVVWGKQAESSSEYLSKGRSVCVEGRLSYSSWETKMAKNEASLKLLESEWFFLVEAGRVARMERKGPATIARRQVLRPQKTTFLFKQQVNN